MSDLTQLFQIGQRVYFRDDGFDAIEPFIPCIVKEVHENGLTLTDTKTDTDLFIEPDFNLHLVHSDCDLPE